MSTSITALIGSFYEAFSGKTELLDAVITDDWDDIPLGPGQEPGLAGGLFIELRFKAAFGCWQLAVPGVPPRMGIARSLITPVPGLRPARRPKVAVMTLPTSPPRTDAVPRTGAVQ